MHFIHFKLLFFIYLFDFHIHLSFRLFQINIFSLIYQFQENYLFLNIQSVKI